MVIANLVGIMLPVVLEVREGPAPVNQHPRADLNGLSHLWGRSHTRVRSETAMWRIPHRPNATSSSSPLQLICWVCRVGTAHRFAILVGGAHPTKELQRTTSADLVPKQGDLTPELFAGAGILSPVPALRI